MVGTDIIEVSRIEKLIKEKGDKFLNKIYTQKEIDYCESKGSNKYQHYAGRFAAKEAAFKAVSGSMWPVFSKIKFKDIEINNAHDGNIGRPYVTINKSIIEDRELSISISISHIKEYATAIAMIDKF